jgi:hypothetical protein
MRTLRPSIRLMMAEILNEKKLLNDFQQQKVKIEIFWNMEKKRRGNSLSFLPLPHSLPPHSYLLQLL